MPAFEDTLSSLAATLQAVQETQRTTSEFNLNAFKRIMEKLDVLPSMQTDIAITKEKLTHLNEKMDSHINDDKTIQSSQEEDIKELQKNGWIQKGVAATIGGLAGFLAEFLHR